MHVPVPDEEGREAIFEVHTRNKPLADNVDLADLARRTEGYVGADIEAVTREAAMAATRELIEMSDPEDLAGNVGNVRIGVDHFDHALEEVNPSVTAETRERYENIESRFNTGEPANNEPEIGQTFQ